MTEANSEFDPLVLKAMAKWPDVPDCYGWLALDRRGNWRLQGEIIAHARAVAFLNRHYTSTMDGRWYVQNGPQRVFVDLVNTPHVCREAGPGRLVTHTGRPVAALSALIVDDEHELVLVTEYGPAILDDRDLLPFTAALALPDRSLGGDDLLAWLVDGTPGLPRITPQRLRWYDAAPEFLRLTAAELPVRYGFVRRPRGGDAGSGHG